MEALVLPILPVGPLSSSNDALLVTALEYDEKKYVWRETDEDGQAQEKNKAEKRRTQQAVV